MTPTICPHYPTHILHSYTPPQAYHTCPPHLTLTYMKEVWFPVHQRHTTDGEHFLGSTQQHTHRQHAFHYLGKNVCLHRTCGRNMLLLQPDST